MYIRRWGDAQDISESLMCVEFTSCVQGEKKASSLLLLLTAFFSYILIIHKSTRTKLFNCPYEGQFL